MCFLAGLMLGLVAGYVSSTFVYKRGEGILGDIVVGMAGAFLAVYLFHVLGSPSLFEFNVWVLLVSAVGAVALLVSVNQIRGDSAITAPAPSAQRD